MASPHSALAQKGTCKPAEVDNPPSVTISTSPTAQVDCWPAEGLELTLESGKEIGRQGDPVSIASDQAALRVYAQDSGNNKVMVTTEIRSAIYSNKRGIEVLHGGAGDTVITHAGTISAAGSYGIAGFTTAAGTGGMEIEAKSDSKITMTGTEGHGILAWIQKNTSTGDVTITHAGTITATGIGLWSLHDGNGDTLITHAGTISAVKEGIRAINLNRRGIKWSFDANSGGKGSVEIETKLGSKITTTNSAHAGIHAEVSVDTVNGEGEITITHAGTITAAGTGVWTNNWGSGDTVITHAGTITAAGTGIVAQSRSPFGEGVGDGTSGKGSVEIETKLGSTITTTGSNFAGIIARVAVGQGHSKGGITIIHNGMITATGSGVFADNRGRGGIDITTGKDSFITAKGTTEGQGGIAAQIINYYFTDVTDWTTLTVSPGADGRGTITVTHAGTITAVTAGIYATNLVPISKGGIKVETKEGSTITTSGSEHGTGIYTANVSKGMMEVTHAGTITAAAEGIHVYNQAIQGSESSGNIQITTAEGSTITAKNQGIRVDQDGTGTFDVRIRGTVMGGNVDNDNNKYAGVHVEGRTSGSGMGGKIVIGTRAHLSAQSKVAIEVDDNAGDVEVMLEKEHGVVGRVQGQILSADDKATGELTFKTRTGEDGSGDILKKDGTGRVLMRGDSKGLYDIVNEAVLTAITGDTEGYEFKTVEGTSWRLYQDRARLYEATAPVLQGLSTPLSYGTRMATPRLTGGGSVIVESTKGEQVEAPQSRTGVWVRLATLEGDRMAKTSTTATGLRGQALSWDIEQTRVAIGLDVPTDDRLLLGVSTHWRQSKATVKDGGTMDVDGMGLGVSLTWTGDNGLYVDGQLSYTRFFDIEVTSNGTMITSTGSGSGVALGLEVGQPMSVGGLTVTPRGGLAWSSVKMDAFVEPTSLGGTGTVSPDRAESVMARVGVQAELAPSEGASRLYGSLDLEHEFRPEFEVMAGTTPLKGKVKPTWVRAGIGGAMPLGSDGRTVLAGDAFYATAGSDNADFGGGVSLTFRF